MEFEWDDAKRLGNIAKHGFDFILAGDHLRAAARPGVDGEPRWLAPGLIRGRTATAIYTLRGDTIRLISLRSARHDERRRHQALFG
jgi:hypothetical protein